MFIDNYEYERIKEQLENLTVYDKQAFIERLLDEHKQDDSTNYVDIEVAQELEMSCDAYIATLTEITDLCEELNKQLTISQNKSRSTILEIVHKYLEQIYDLSLDR